VKCSDSKGTAGKLDIGYRIMVMPTEKKNIHSLYKVAFLHTFDMQSNISFSLKKKPQPTWHSSGLRIQIAGDKCLEEIPQSQFTCTWLKCQLHL